MSLSWTPWWIGLKPGSANDLIRAKDGCNGALANRLGIGPGCSGAVGRGSPTAGDGRSAARPMPSPVMGIPHPPVSNQCGRFGAPADRHRRLALHGQPGADFAAATPNPGNQWRQFALAGAGSDCPTDPPRQALLLTLQLGELKIRELAVLVMPKASPGSDGVLGASALRQLPMLIDPKRQQVRLDQQLSVQSAPADAIRLPLQWRDHVLLVQVSDQSGKSSLALLDTGAEAVFVGVPLAQRLTPQSPTSGVEIQGFCGSEFAVERLFSGLSVGDIPWSNRQRS